MNIGALVPARLGSRRLPRKNILPFEGRPLLCRTLDVLLESNVFCDVTVSTESAEIASLVRQHYPAGEVAVLLRPEALAGDDAPLAKVADHYMESRPHLHWGGLFMPTFPFRRASRLVEAAAAIHTGYPLRVQAVRPEQHWDNDYYFPHEGGFAPIFAGFPNLLRFSSTSYMLWRRETPQCTAMRLGYRLSEREHRIRIDLDETVDIDTPADLDLAKRLAAGASLAQTPVATTACGPWFVQAPAEATEADRAAFLDWLGPELLDDPTTPILILQRPEPPLFTARLAIDLPELHFLNATAQDHTWSPRYVATANTAHCLPVYQQSPVWRLIPKDAPLHAPPSPIDRAALGQPIAAEERLIAAERVRFVEDMAKLPFYRGAYTVAGGEATAEATAAAVEVGRKMPPAAEGRHAPRTPRSVAA